MEKSTKLNINEVDNLLRWVDSFELTRCNKKLCRDFSDAVLTAEILKYEFPKLVELHNYPARNALNLKIDNWNTLNRKVLKKMNIQLKPEDIEKLSRADSERIEEFLFDVMNRIDFIKTSESQMKLMRKSSDSKTDIMTVTVQKQIGDHIENVAQRMIEYSIYEKLQKDHDVQQAEIESLKHKNEHYCELIELKTQIIVDLQQQLEKRHQNYTIDTIKESFTSFF
ncbi:unnamed protein product [Diamesa serratosioi]